MMRGSCQVISELPSTRKTNTHYTHSLLKSTWAENSFNKIWNIQAVQYLDYGYEDGKSSSEFSSDRDVNWSFFTPFFI